jgi:hypothetical protein
MKMKNFRYKMFAAGLALIGLVAACSDDFLERKPLDTIVDANFYQTADQVLAGSAPLYNIVWFAYNDKASHGIGDGRGGVLSANYSYQLENIQFKTSAATSENITSWRAFYNVVGQSNTLINNIKKYAGPNVPASIKNHAIAEARFMRGLAYSYLVQNWGAVPIITDNTTLLQDTTIQRNTVESVWEFICRDLRYGTINLPETPIQTGRLTKWAAEGMLAKMYLTRAGVGKSAGSRDQVYLDSARILAKDVIDKSGKSLVANYEDLFKTKNNNNSETLFALQWTYNGTWGSQNSVQAFLAYSSSITGFADGWGGDLGASMYILGKYEGLIDNGNTPDTRRKATFMFPGDHYNYVHQQVLDPNGNPQIQELRVPNGGSGYNNRAWVKKYVVGRPEDNDGKVQQQRTEIQTYMLRLADVYLVYAEAILGNASSTIDPQALQYYNAVRTRAGVPAKSSITWDDIFNERHVEFAMEGQLWYDFVRLHYYDPAKAYSILSSQDKGFTRITPDKIPDPTKWTIIDEPTSSVAKFYTVDDSNFMIPLPEAELSRAPNLRKSPVPYTFK